jgi:hypothetical protein
MKTTLLLDIYSNGTHFGGSKTETDYLFDMDDAAIMRYDGVIC